MNNNDFAFSNLLKDNSTLTFLAVASVIALILLILVRIVHGQVTRGYTKVSGLEGLVDEEKRAKSLGAEKKALEKAIHEHEQTISKERELQDTIRKLTS